MDMESSLIDMQMASYLGLLVYESQSMNVACKKVLTKCLQSQALRLKVSASI